MLGRMSSQSSHGRDDAASASEQDSNYAKWSNADLIDRVTHLEKTLRAQNLKLSQARSRETSPVPKTKTPKKASKAFDASKYSTRYIALKFAYLGKRYNGFEHHANNNTRLPTVEEELWRALRKTKLIFPHFEEGRSEDEVCWNGCDYSKCGRTDKGVSAFGQVIGIRVRSSRPKEMIAENGVHPSDEGDLDSAKASASELFQDEAQKDELPYIQLLNRVLSSDIRVLAWCPHPPPDFSARFSCKERRYRYFFTNPAYLPMPHSSDPSSGASNADGWLDIQAMQQAAKKFEGLHDFRNFCKVDPSKQIANFERRIFYAGIAPAGSELDAGAFLARPPFTSSKPMEVFYFEVHGSAFLWHQVRHMVAVLFLVGQGYESPEVVDRLLDVQSCPAKPVYEMADDTPLVLWDCVFPDTSRDSNSDHAIGINASGYVDDLEWIYVGDGTPQVVVQKKSNLTEAMQDRKYGRLGVMEDLWSQWRSSKIDEVLAGSLMNIVAQQGKRHPSEHAFDARKKDHESARLFDGSDTPRNAGRYVPLMRRARLETPEIQNARYAVRKGWNSGLGSQDDPDINE